MPLAIWPVKRLWLSNHTLIWDHAQAVQHRFPQMLRKVMDRECQHLELSTPAVSCKARQSFSFVKIKWGCLLRSWNCAVDQIIPLALPSGKKKYFFLFNKRTKTIDFSVYREKEKTTQAKSSFSSTRFKCSMWIFFF